MKYKLSWEFKSCFHYLITLAFWYCISTWVLLLDASYCQFLTLAPYSLHHRSLHSMTLPTTSSPTSLPSLKPGSTPLPPAELIDFTIPGYSLFSAPRTSATRLSKSLSVGGIAFFLKEPVIQNSSAHFLLFL